MQVWTDVGPLCHDHGNPCYERSIKYGTETPCTVSSRIANSWTVLLSHSYMRNDIGDDSNPSPISLGETDPILSCLVIGVIGYMD